MSNDRYSLVNGNDNDLSPVEVKFSSIQVDHLSIAEKLMAVNDFVTMKDTGEIYLYQDGVYRPNGEVFIQERARRLLGDHFTSHRVKEITNSIRYSTFVSRDSFDNDIKLINLENGLLNIETLEFFKHTPEHRSLVRIPVTYHPSADCPSIKKFFQEVL